VIASALLALPLVAQTATMQSNRGQPSQGPRADLGALLGPADYPAAARAAGEEGAVTFRLEVGADGRVTGCTVTRSSGSAALDAGTCAIIRERARYRPATDGEGRAVAGTDMGRINWRLPPPEPPAVAIPAENCAGCTPPRANLGSLFSTDDYPPLARRDRQEGRVAFRILIGIDGRVKRCDVTATSGSHALDLMTCAILLARARYRPASDPSGNPVDGVDNGYVDWRLPDS